MTKSNTGHTAVVAHDAGAAEQIFAWFKSGLLNIEICKFYLTGPAKNSFSSIRKDITFTSLEDVLNGAKILLSGTGWSSSLEYDARMIAKKEGIKSIAVIDHWVNYPERFIRNNLKILPDIIWVSDKYAYQEAKQCFPDIEIIKQKNNYIEYKLKEISRHKIDKKKNVTNILYLLEPIRDKWAGDDVAGEFQALDFFMHSIPRLNFGEKFDIVLRPHPSDSDDKYNSWLNSLRSPKIHIEKEKDLASMLAWSDVVVGCETYAMTVALAANKRVISSLPKHAHNCRLPHDNIERLNQI